MIDYINYVVDGKTYRMNNNGDGSWSKEANAPNVAGNYNLFLEISDNGIVSYIDSSDSRYSTFLEVFEDTAGTIQLEDYLPRFFRNITEFNIIFDAQGKLLDFLNADINKVINAMFITMSSNDTIARLEKFIGIQGQGTLAQRKSYILALLRNGRKFNQSKIKEIVKTIAGADCITKFYSSSELGNPDPGFGLLRVQVLSPDNNIDYRYEDILRALKPLIPGHIKLAVVKYFALWNDVKLNFTDWKALSTMKDWQAVKSYIPPQ